MSFYEQKNIVLGQNGNLLNHVSNYEIFHKNIVYAKYFAKYSNQIHTLNTRNFKNIFEIMIDLKVEEKCKKLVIAIISIKI